MDENVVKAELEVVDRNIKAAIGHSNETRNLIRALEEKVDHLTTQVEQLALADQQKQQEIHALRMRVYTGGATGGD